MVADRGAGQGGMELEVLLTALGAEDDWTRLDDWMTGRDWMRLDETEAEG